MTQLSLPLSRRTDPATSHKAAERVGEFRSSHEDRILGALQRSPGGLTYRDIAQVTGMEPVAVARRLKGMEEKNLVRRYKRGEDYIERSGMAVWWITGGGL